MVADIVRYLAFATRLFFVWPPRKKPVRIGLAIAIPLPTRPIIAYPDVVEDLPPTTAETFRLLYGAIVEERARCQSVERKPEREDSR